jgi:hypothetical protein
MTEFRGVSQRWLKWHLRGRLAALTFKIATVAHYFEPAEVDGAVQHMIWALIQRDRALPLTWRRLDLLIFVRGRSGPSMRGDQHSFVWVGATRRD